MAQTAILGAGVMGETLLSGLVRAGRRVDNLLVGEKRAERARELEERYGVDTYILEFRTVLDQESSLRRDIRRIRSFPMLPADLVVGGAVYDVDTGRLTPFDT